MNPTSIPPWLTRVARVEAFCDYLCSLGRDATMFRLPEKTSADEETPASSWRERHLVHLARSPIRLVTLYAARIEPKVVSLAHHYVVRTDENIEASEALLDARIVRSLSGVIGRRKPRITFSGGLLANELQQDVGLRSALLSDLDPADDVQVVPDTRRGLVRIVHIHPVSAGRPLFLPSEQAFHERLLPAGLLGAFERMALHIRAFTARKPDAVASRSA